MARNYLRLGTYYRNEKWTGYARQMLANMYDGMETYGSGYSNWAQLLLEMNQGMVEVHLMEVQSSETVSWPGNALLSYHQEIPMSASYATGIFVCGKGTCYPALTTLKAAVDLIEEEIN